MLDSSEIDSFIEEHPGSHLGKMAKEVASSLIKAVDHNNDKKIDLVEFATLQPWFVRYLSSITPHRNRRFEDGIKMCPPPFAIITISLIQAVYFAIQVNEM